MDTALYEQSVRRHSSGRFVQVVVTLFADLSSGTKVLPVMIAPLQRSMKAAGSGLSLYPVESYAVLGEAMAIRYSDGVIPIRCLNAR